MALKKKGLAAYGDVSVKSGTAYADQVQLIQMLFDGLVDTLSLAEGQLIRGEIKDKGKSLTKAVRILSGLQNALDDQQGGEIAANLAELYDYCIRRVLHANLKNDVEAVKEVRSLIDEVREAWAQIPDLIQQPIANAG